MSQRRRERGKLPPLAKNPAVRTLTMKRFAHTLPLLAVLVTQSGCDTGSPTGMGALEPVLAKSSNAP